MGVVESPRSVAVCTDIGEYLPMLVDVGLGKPRHRGRVKQMSFTHIVTFKWKFPDQSAKAAATADALRAFVANLDGVESYLCGSDIGLTPSSHHFAVVGTFTTQSDFENYRDHPQHQRIITEQIAPILADRTVVQLES